VGSDTGLVPGDCYVAIQKNEALFVHLHCELQGSLSEGSMVQSSVCVSFSFVFKKRFTFTWICLGV
jgi:hypothetical protein